MEETFVDHLYRRLSGFHWEYFKHWDRFTDVDLEIVTFPLWNVSGRLCGYQAYNWKSNKKKRNDSKGRYWTYRTKESDSVFGLEFIDLFSTEPLYVVEGIWDAISVLSAGYRCIAVLSNTPQNLKPWLRTLPCKTIALCDGDKAGKMLSRVCDDKIILPEGKDCNDMTIEGIKEILNGR